MDKKKKNQSTTNAPANSPQNNEEEKKQNNTDLKEKAFLTGTNSKFNSSTNDFSKTNDSQSKSHREDETRNRKKCSSPTGIMIQITIYAIIIVSFLSYLSGAHVLVQETFGNLGVANAYQYLITSNNTIASELFKNQYGPDIQMKYPVVFVPGIISSRLELWQAKECAQSHFRDKIWASPTMIRMALLSKNCWIEHIVLNQTDWTDPKGIKVRATSGLAAADFFIADYWIWGKIIANLARFGYDENSMLMASYDWRLPFQYLEDRDRYFTKLKASIELLKEIHGQKAMVVAHSFGGSVLHYFMKWVESPIGGNAPKWNDRYIKKVVHIGVPWLGVPKSLATVVSGEMKDTADLNPLLGFLKDNFFTREEFFYLLRSIGSVANMLPKGGNKIWNNDYFGTKNESWAITFEEDFTAPQIHAKCELINEPAVPDEVRKNVTTKKIYSMEEALQLARNTFPNYMNLSETFTFLGIINPASSSYDDSPKFWSNPLSSALPFSSDLKIYSFYGIGKPTERSYHYMATKDKCIPYVMNTIGSDENEDLLNGVQLTDGDGTVPLISLGCTPKKIWRDRRYNPGQIKSIVREYKNFYKNILSFDGDLRGGPENSDHVDILGNSQLNFDILTLATGVDEDLGDRVFSNIDEICSRLKF